jgi:hypothetical protein
MQGSAKETQLANVPFIFPDCQSQVTATLQLTSGYPLAYLTGPAHAAGEITVKINYP